MSVLPPALGRAATRLLWQRFGTDVSIRSATTVAGGDINHACCLDLGGQDRAFLKYNPHPLPGMFECEAKGLQLLAATRTLRVPGVLGVDPGAPSHPPFLLLEWIEADARPDGSTARRFGRRLARLHQTTQAEHGLDHDNFIGPLPQPNTPSASWTAFYRDRRLGVMQRVLQDRGRLTARRHGRLLALSEALPDLIGEENPPPSLLHGDLWGGNYLTRGGEAVLIDPAVSFGHREVEVAFTELFGGFSADFYEGYNDIWPLPGAYAGRKRLYQLYPLLVHLVLFGETYGARVDAVLDHYVR